MRNFLDRYLPVFQMPDAPTTPASEPAASPSGGGSSSPTPSDSPPPSSTPDVSGPGSTDGGDAFSFLFGEAPDEGAPLESVSIPTTPSGGPSPQSATPQPQATPSTTPPAQPPASEPAQPAAQATPQSPTPAPTEATSPAAQPNLDPYDPGALAQHLLQNEKDVVQFVADNTFKLSPEDVEALESDTVGTIPKLLARTFVQSQRNLLMHLSRIVPQMIERHSQVTAKGKEAEGQFYSRWPDIQRAKDTQVDVGGKRMSVADLVMQYAVVYGQMHPEASRQQRIEAVGPMVMMAAGITPGAVQPQSQAPVVSQSPMGVPMNGRPPQVSPFVPASPSAGGASPQAPMVEHPVVTMFTGDPDE